MMRELGGVFGIAIAVAVFAGAGSYASPQAFTDGFGPAIGVAAALALVGAVAGSFLPGHGREGELTGAPAAVVEAEYAAMRRVIVRYRVKPDQADATSSSSARCTRSCTARTRPASATRPCAWTTG